MLYTRQNQKPDQQQHRQMGGIENVEEPFPALAPLTVVQQNRHTGGSSPQSIANMQKILNEKLLALFKAAAAFAKSAALWLGLVILLLILLAGIISGIAGSMVGSSSTLILSPAESTSGKINLAPYSQIIRSEMTRFNGEIANVMSRYEDNDAYDNVTMQYSGVSNNSRELLSMMAVRMGQNLDLEQNPNVKDYLVSLYRASHSYSVVYLFFSRQQLLPASWKKHLSLCRNLHWTAWAMWLSRQILR